MSEAETEDLVISEFEKDTGVKIFERRKLEPGIIKLRFLDFHLENGTLNGNQRGQNLSGDHLLIRL